MAKKSTLTSFLLGGQVALGLGVEHLQAAVEHARGLDQRPLEVQAGAEVGAHDLAEVEHDRGLAFADDEDRAQQRQQRGDDGRRSRGKFHRRRLLAAVGRGLRSGRGVAGRWR